MIKDYIFLNYKKPKTESQKLFHLYYLLCILIIIQLILSHPVPSVVSSANALFNKFSAVVERGS